jgi:hypothetical protein
MISTLFVRLFSRLAPCGLVLAAAALFSNCSTPVKSSRGALYSINFDPPVHRPNNPANMRVKISTGAQKLYIVEGDRVLFASPCSVGMPGHATPAGNFRAYNKIAHKRSGSYGFSIEGGNIRACEARNAHGRYVGYPMPNWIEFTSGYGIHCGYVKPYPCTHGCVRLPKWAAAKAFALIHEGTPISVAYSHPEDQTVGKTLPHFDDTTLPDPPATQIVSDSYFQDHVYRGNLFAN